MATVLRSPFWVPRPSDDFAWNAAPTKSPIIAYLTKQKIYAAGGQVPTKRWLPYYTYDVGESQWDARPVRPNASLYVVVLAPFKPKRWNYDLDNPPMWQGESVNSATIQLLTVGGKVKPFRWNATLDDAASWSGEPINSATLQLLTNVNFPLFTPYLWRLQYTQNDPPMWQGAPTERNAPLFLAEPFENRQTYWYSEDSAWIGAPVRSATLSMLSTGKVAPFRWNATLDDPPSWQQPPQRNAPLNAPSGTPFTSRVPTWYAEDAFWSGGPARSVTLSMLTTAQVKPFRWNATLDDPPSWQQQKGFNQSLNTPSGRPTVPRFWNVSPVDDPPWSWQWWVPINLNPVPIEFISNARVRWNFDDDAPSWQQPRGLNQVINTTFGKPVTSRPAPFFSEDTLWSGRPLRSDTLAMLSVGGKVKPFQWNWGLDESPPWLQPKGFNQPLNTAAQPFIRPIPLWYSEDAFWQGNPVGSASALLNSRPFANYRTQWLSEESVWSARLARSNTLSLLTAGGIRKAKFWRWDFDVGESFWQGAPVGYVIDLPVTGKPRTLPWFSYWAHANFDIDAPGWVGAPRNAANTVNPIPPPPVRRFTPMIMRLGRLSHSIRR